MVRICWNLTEMNDCSADKVAFYNEGPNNRFSRKAALNHRHRGSSSTLSLWPDCQIQTELTLGSTHRALGRVGMAPCADDPGSA